MVRFHVLLTAGSFIALSACAATPDPIAETIEIPTQPIETCVPVSALKQVIVPAVTKKVIAITQIENPPYEPIQRREEQTRVVTPEQVFYVDESGKEVTDICDAPVTPETMEP